MADENELNYQPTDSNFDSSFQSEVIVTRVERWLNQHSDEKFFKAEDIMSDIDLPAKKRYLSHVLKHTENIEQWSDGTYPTTYINPYFQKNNVEGKA